MKHQFELKLFLVLSLFLAISISAQAQTYATVIAPSGLSVRSKPSLQAERIGKLEFGNDVEIRETTDQKLEVKDGNKWVKGNWVRIRAKDGFTGYAFDGYLLTKPSKPERNGISCDDELPCDTRVKFDAFTAVIHSYQSERRQYPPTSGDTLVYYEFVFNDISEKVLQIIPEQADDRIEVFFTRNETIIQQYDRKGGPNFDWDRWAKERVSWHGNAGYEKMEGKNNYFRIPGVQWSLYEKKLKERMGLRDTLVVIEGEYDDVATVVYKEKVCGYSINFVLIKVVIHRDGKQIVRYLEMGLSYGC